MDIVAFFRKYSRAGLYILLTFLSFYCACYRLPVGLKYGVNLVVFAWACMEFFIRPNFDHAMFCMRFFALFFFPYLLFWMWSVGIWISEFQTFDYILRGSLNIFYMLTNLLFVVAAVYLFEDKVINYTIVSMTAANSLVALQVAAGGGVAAFIQQYIRLILTFADDTGPLMRSMELHDMVYGWGVCVIYYLIHKEKKWQDQVLCLGVSVLYFTMGFKRIAMPAVAGAVLVYYILLKWKPKHLHFMTNLVAILCGAGNFFYLWMIKSGLFVKLAKQFGISLMYRDVLYSYFSQFFELLPTYLGRGIRFIYTYATEDPKYPLATPATHNVYLEFYLEVGFWCWWIWILYELAFRIHRIDERYGAKPAYVLMAMNIYVFFTYLTDNTSFYYPINVLYRMAVMVVCYEAKEKEKIVDSEMRTTEELKDLRKQEDLETNTHGFYKRQ